MSYVVTDLSTVWGRTAEIVFTVGDLGASGLNAFNDIRFSAKRDDSDADSAAVISKSLSSGITITTVGNVTTDGVLSVALAPADTTALPAGYAVALTYDVAVYDASGDAYSTHSGTLTITPTATQATT